MHATAPDPLPGPTIQLVDVHEADVEVLHAWFLQSDPQRLTCRPLGEQSAASALQRFHAAQTTPRQQQRAFAVRRVADDALVGRVRYFDGNPRNRSVEVGVLVAPEHRRRGVALEAMTLLLVHLFGDLGLNKVMAQTGAFNEATLALLRTLGFREEGRLRQHHLLDGELHDDVLLSVLAGEWLQS